MPEKNNSARISPLYRVIKFFVWLFYPRTEAVGAENLPDEPVIVVGNHAQMNGPIACELYFPGRRYIWCAAEMMAVREVPAYAYKDFWSQKPAASRWFYKILSYIIAPFSACIFNNAGTIAVYRDRRVVDTFRESEKRLSEGASVIIFPEHDKPRNNIICEFQEGFVDVARMHYRKTGRELCFVPLYVAPALKKLYIGEPVRFRADAPFKEERERICRELMEAITRMGRDLPPHRVVPYKNVPKKDYPSNKDFPDGKDCPDDKDCLDGKNFPNSKEETDAQTRR